MNKSKLNVTADAFTIPSMVELSRYANQDVNPAQAVVADGEVNQGHEEAVTKPTTALPIPPGQSQDAVSQSAFLQRVRAYGQWCKSQVRNIDRRTVQVDNVIMNTLDLIELDNMSRANLIGGIIKAALEEHIDEIRLVMSDRKTLFDRDTAPDDKKG